MPTDVELGSDLVTYVARLFRALRRDREVPAGIRVLSLLDEHGSLGITRLAAVDRCSQPTMSEAVAQLAASGWVAKQPNPEDGRGSVVSLTAEGRAELARVRRRHGEQVAALVAAHPAHTTKDLGTAVALLRDVLAAIRTEEEIS